MAQPGSFYDYGASLQGLRYDELLCTLLNSCHRVMSHSSADALGELISHVIQEHQLDGYYRLELCDQVYIEHFQQGRRVIYQGERPNKGGQRSTVKVVELEHAIIFKMHFIHLYLSKDHGNYELLEDSRDIWLLWLMHIESVCLQLSLQNMLKQDFNPKQQEHALSINYHLDLNVNMTRLARSMKELYQVYDEQVMSLLNPSEFIANNKRQQLLICALTAHQDKLSTMIRQQYGLYVTSQRLLQAILSS